MNGHDQRPRYRKSLDRLYQHLRATSNFSSAFDLFDTTFGTDRQFIASSKPAKSVLIDRVIEHLAGGASCARFTPLLRYAPGRFLHGAFRIGSRIAVVFYFEEHDIGLATVCGSTTSFARFSKLDLPPGTSVTRDRGQS